MMFDVGKAKENLGTVGDGLSEPGSSTISPFGSRFDRLVGLGEPSPTKMRCGSRGTIVGDRSRELASATKPPAFENPLAWAFLGMPSKNFLGIDAGWRGERQASKAACSPGVLASAGSEFSTRASGRFGAAGALGHSPCEEVADGIRLLGELQQGTRVAGKPWVCSASAIV